VPGTPILHLSLPVPDLADARRFYEEVLGCRVGRVREDWLDVWFFGLQLTLHRRPEEVRPVADQGVRHVGVVLDDREEYLGVVERVRAAGWAWIAEPTVHTRDGLSGKEGGKLADPGGNVIEVKYYADRAAFLGQE
jgi:uncharacterized protein